MHFQTGDAEPVSSRAGGFNFEEEKEEEENEVLRRPISHKKTSLRVGDAEGGRLGHSYHVFLYSDGYLFCCST